MRVTVVRSPELGARARAALRGAGLGPLLRSCGDALRVPETASLTVRLTGDGELRELNRRFAGEDAATDVLAFPAGEPGRVGDVAISVERALAQARSGAAGELRLLAVHGLLHCVGHGHDGADEAAAMTAATRRLLPGEDVPALVAG